MHLPGVLQTADAGPQLGVADAGCGLNVSFLFFGCCCLFLISQERCCYVVKAENLCSLICSLLRSRKSRRYQTRTYFTASGWEHTCCIGLQEKHFWKYKEKGEWKKTPIRYWTRPFSSAANKRLPYKGGADSLGLFLRISGAESPATPSIPIPGTTMPFTKFLKEPFLPELSGGYTHLPNKCALPLPSPGPENASFFLQPAYLVTGPQDWLGRSAGAVGRLSMGREAKMEGPHSAAIPVSSRPWRHPEPP